MFATRLFWAALGAAVTITAGVTSGLGFAQADSYGDPRPVVVPITPCRVLDTRPATQIGPIGAPLGPSGTVDVAGRGTTGECTIPAGAIGLSLNVTAVGATEQTNLRLYPTGAPMPEASSLNPAPDAPPAPNAVLTDLSADGRFTVRNFQGSVHVVIDINGYLVDHDHDERYANESEVTDLREQFETFDPEAIAELVELVESVDPEAIDRRFDGAEGVIQLLAERKADRADVYERSETYSREEIDARPTVHWLAVGPDGSVRGSSDSLIGTQIFRTRNEPQGSYCIALPIGLQSELAGTTGSIEQLRDEDRSWDLSVTTTLNNECALNGQRYNIGVQTFHDGQRTDAYFRLVIPVA